MFSSLSMDSVEDSKLLLESKKDLVFLIKSKEGLRPFTRVQKKTQIIYWSSKEISNLKL